MSVNSLRLMAFIGAAIVFALLSNSFAEAAVLMG
jgi:hypothetical protein